MSPTLITTMIVSFSDWGSMFSFTAICAVLNNATIIRHLVSEGWEYRYFYAITVTLGLADIDDWFMELENRHIPCLNHWYAPILVSVPIVYGVFWVLTSLCWMVPSGINAID